VCSSDLFAGNTEAQAADVGGGIRARRGAVPVWVERGEESHEKGFSLLIKEAGTYKIGGLDIQAARAGDGLVVHIKGTQNG
jgi:hypothetical protein